VVNWVSFDILASEFGVEYKKSLLLGGSIVTFWSKITGKTDLGLNMFN